MLLRFVALTAFGVSAAACASSPSPSVPRAARAPEPRLEIEESVAPPAPPPDPAHWYFEGVSRDGTRALLRRLDGEARAALETRVVDVDSGRAIDDAAFPELGKLRFAIMGSKASQLSELEDVLGGASLGKELARAAHLASPFGAFGRLSASSSTDSAVAFNAGDWLYVADGGHAPKRLTEDAAYDPRFTPDGAHLFFRRVTGMIDHRLAKYELFVVPTDLSAPPRALPETAGARDALVVDAERHVAIGVASREPQITTCVLSIALRPPFAVKRVACLEGNEQLVESILSPRGRWAAITTQSARPDVASAIDAADSGCASGAKRAKLAARGVRRPTWRLRVVSVESGKIVLDEPAETGMPVRAISDAGLLVESGPRGAGLVDARTKARHPLADDVEIGHRAFFRNGAELVVARGASVAVIDVTKN